MEEEGLRRIVACKNRRLITTKEFFSAHHNQCDQMLECLAAKIFKKVPKK